MKDNKGWNGYTWSYNCVYYQGRIIKVGMDIHDLITVCTIKERLLRLEWIYMIL